LPFIAPAALQLHSHSTTMLIKLRLAGTINCGAILRHLILDATLKNSFRIGKGIITFNLWTTRANKIPFPALGIFMFFPEAAFK